MKLKKTIYKSLLISLFAFSIAISFFKVSAEPELPVHNMNTKLDYATIQEAIDAPETLSGHTIFVEEGIYHENLHMDKSLSLIGENREKTVVDRDGILTSPDYDYVLVINRTSNVVVKGFTFQNCHVGVFLLLCNLSRISDNRMRDCSWYGIWIYK